MSAGDVIGAGCGDVSGAVCLLPLLGVPEVRAGDDLAGLLHTALQRCGGLQDGDVLVVSSKVISKALGLREHGPQDVADRRESVLEHSTRVVAERATGSGITRIVEAVAGPVMAAAGLDASNTGPDGGVLVLPSDPDAAAGDLHAALRGRLSGDQPAHFGVVISDTAGRPWRAGQTDFALGAYGVQVLDDLRGAVDADGRGLNVTSRALADELAAAADLVKGKISAVPAALVRGVSGAVAAAPSAETPDPGARAEPWSPSEDPGARRLLRTGPGDWFALGHVEAVRAALGAPPGSQEATLVGIPPVGGEEPEMVATRAVRLALLGHPAATVTGSAAQGYAVHAADPVTAGRVAARLEMALAAEMVPATQAVVTVDVEYQGS